MLWDLVSCGHTTVTKQVNERESSFWELTKLTEHPGQQHTAEPGSHGPCTASSTARPSCACHTVHTHSPTGAHRLGDQ